MLNSAAVSNFTRKDGGGKSVLYTAEPIIEESALATAQRFALAEKLPLAAVYCALKKPDNELLQKLKKAEVQLAACNIPFILMLGSWSDKLPLVVSHFQPKAVFGNHSDIAALIPDYAEAEAKMSSDSQVILHPHQWPGKVLSLGELEAIGFAGC